MKSILLYTFLLLCVLYGLTSCEDCTIETQNIQTIRLKFVKSTDTTAIDTTFSRVYGIGALGEDLYNTASGKHTIFELPVFTASELSGFIFESGGEKDTLLFRYDIHIDVYTPDCGYDERVENLQISAQTYENVRLLHTTLQSNQTHDVEVFQ